MPWETRCMMGFLSLIRVGVVRVDVGVGESQNLL